MSRPAYPLSVAAAAEAMRLYAAGMPLRKISRELRERNLTGRATVSHRTLARALLRACTWQSPSENTEDLLRPPRCAPMIEIEGGSPPPAADGRGQAA